MACRFIMHIHISIGEHKQAHFGLYTQLSSKLLVMQKNVPSKIFSFLFRQAYIHRPITDHSTLLIVVQNLARSYRIFFKIQYNFEKRYFSKYFSFYVKTKPIPKPNLTLNLPFLFRNLFTVQANAGIDISKSTISF